MLRCKICDYTQEEGSEFAYRAPSTKVHVHQMDNGDFLCDECELEYQTNLEDLSANDIDEDEVE